MRLGLVLVLAACSGSSDAPPADARVADAPTPDATVPTIDAPVCIVGRSTTERPDDSPLAQVHVIYVLPSDGVDESLDTNGTLARSVGAWNRWLGNQTGGPRLRLDTCGGVLDVTFFRMTRTDADVAATGAFVRDTIEVDLAAAGRIAPNKLYAVYYGGTSTYACGGGAWPPSLTGRVAAMYLKGQVTGYPPCSSNPWAPNEDTPGYLEFAMLHELMHSVGVTATCALHHTLSGHTSDSPTDLMYAGTQAWQPSVLDVGRDDYYAHSIAGCLDLADSALVDPLPASPQLPPGW